MKIKRQNLFRKILSLALVAIIGVLPTVSTFAAEKSYEAEASVDSNDYGELVEDIDPNIIVTVTELEEPPVMGRSFYSSTFNYKSQFVGAYRDYDGNSLGAELSTQTSSGSGGSFELQLIRWGSTTVIAKATLPQNGNFHVDFTNVGAGKYAFGFKQTNLIGRQQWGTINMFSW